MTHSAHFRFLLIFTSLLMLVTACAVEQTDESVQVVQVVSATPTAEPTATQRVVRETAAPPTAAPTEAAIPTETTIATIEPTPTAIPNTPTAIPVTATPVATATAGLVVPQDTAWLDYVNLFRGAAGLRPVQEASTLSGGAYLHSEYMARNDNSIARFQKQENPYFTEAGNLAAINGNIFAMSLSEANYLWAVNFWMSAPFHAVGILDPQLERVGYGNFRDDLGAVRVAAVLDVESGVNPAAGATYPVYFPANGGETWILRQNLLEYPEPLSHCEGYRKPVGPPLIVQIGAGEQVPQVSGFSFTADGVPLEACVFDETTYTNGNEFAQTRGRQLLNERDAIVMIPREPLGIGQTYVAQIEANGQLFEWSFTAVAPPPISAAPIEPAPDVIGWNRFNADSLEWGGQTHDFENLRLMRETGMGWVKFQQKWRSDSQPEELIQRIDLAKAYGFKVLVALPGDPYPESIDFAAYTEFLRGVAALENPPDAIEV